MGDDGETHYEHRQRGYHKPDHYSFSNCSKRLIAARGLEDFGNVGITHDVLAYHYYFLKVKRSNSAIALGGSLQCIVSPTCFRTHGREEAEREG